MSVPLPCACGRAVKEERPATGPSRRLPLLVLALLLAGNAAGASHSFLRVGPPAPTDIDDLALIPADGLEFLSVRVADLWQTPAVQKAVASVQKRFPKEGDPAARLENEFGLRPQEVERASVAVVDRDRRLVWVVVRTLVPYDARKVLSRLEGQRQRVHRGKRYSVGKRLGGESAVWMASPRVLVMGPEEGVRHCIALAAGKAPRGQLQPAIERCQEKHHVVAGLDGTALEPLAGALILSWLTPIRLAWGTIDVADDVSLEVHAQAVDEKQAKDLRRTLRQLISDVLSAEEEVGFPVVGWGLGGLVGQAKPEQKGREVIARHTGDASWLLERAVRLAGNPALAFDDPPLYRVRSYFSVLKVEKRITWGGGDSEYPTHSLFHGNTLHGKQFTQADLRDIPLTYYHRTGPVGQVFRAYNTDPRRAFAVIDLGVGTMACYGLPGQTVDFYDSERELMRLSFDTDEYFSFIEDAERRGVNVSLVLGDPRLTFAPDGTRERLKPLHARKGAPRPKRRYGLPIKPDFKYRLIVVDTLSPYAIPGHQITKLTREAVKTYFDRLEEDGVVLLDISNRYFDLLPVLANIAEDLGLACFQLSDEDEPYPGKSRSHWVALARKPGHLSRVLSAPRWTRDPAQLNLLGAALWPANGSPSLAAMSGLCHAGQVLADIQARNAHKENGRPIDTSLDRTDWEPLETTAELRRRLARLAKEVRDLTERINALEKKRAHGGSDAELEGRMARLKEARTRLRREEDRTQRKIQDNARVGVWTDSSADLLNVFVP